MPNRYFPFFYTTAVSILLIHIFSQCHGIDNTSRLSITHIMEKANEGDEEHQLSLGIHYFNGTVVEQNFAKAVYWFEKAAEQSNPHAQRYLGLLYDFGIGVNRDRKKAFTLYLSAANTNDPAACLDISSFPLFYRESIMDSSYGNYHDWKIRAFCLAELFDCADNLEASFWNTYYTGVELHIDDSILVAEVRNRATGGDTKSQLDMARLLMHSQGTEKDNAEIKKWLFLAAENGNPYAQFFIGNACENDFFPLPEYEEQRALLEKAALSNVEKYFIFQYGTLSLLNRNNEAYVSMLNNLCTEKYVPAMHTLGRWHIANSQPNDTLGYELIRSSSQKGYVKSHVVLAALYCLGIGCEVDYKEALSVIEKMEAYPDSMIWHQLRHTLFFTEGKSGTLEAARRHMAERAEEGNRYAQLASAVLAEEDVHEKMKKHYLLMASLNDCIPALFLLSHILYPDEYETDPLVPVLFQYLSSRYSNQLEEMQTEDMNLKSLCSLIPAMTGYIPAMCRPFFNELPANDALLTRPSYSLHGGIFYMCLSEEAFDDIGLLLCAS